MREILFRGKRTGDGEWVEGYLTYRHRYDQQSRKEILGPVIDSQQEVTLGNTSGKVICSYQVAPETVGQYTGLTDKNGKKIFEDDIVVVRYEQSDGEIEQEVKRVHYNSKECCWYPMRWDEHCDFCDNWTEILSLEVIGNIHDNQELLEG